MRRPTCLSSSPLKEGAMGEAHDFLAALFDGAPRGAAIQIWNKSDKRTFYFAAVSAAGDHVQSVKDSDVYVAAGLGAKVLKPNRTRVPAASIAAIPGVWADIDVNGGPEGKTGAAPNTVTALQLAEAVLPPTVVVNSGYGVQAWWLFEEGPWAFYEESDRQQAARLSHAFQAHLRGVAKDMGFSLDSTHDLARLMRVPGSLNHKGADTGHEPQPVTLLNVEGPRYPRDVILEVVQEHLAASATESLRKHTGQNVGVELRGTAAVPSWRVGQLLAVDVEFKAVWDRKKGGRTKDWSDSEFDLSICSRLADAGCDDQEIADALIHNRLQHGDPKGKSQREDYIKQTIGRARTRADLAEAERESEQARNDAVEQLQVIASEGASAEPSRTVSLFTQLLGGPEIKELVQDSRDPDQARFRLVLADGREVPIGTGGDLLNPERFRTAFAVVTGHVVPSVKKDKWHKIVQALLHAATINESQEDTRASRGLQWVRDYIDRGLSTDRDAACQALDPFEHEGDVHVALQPFVHWLRRIRGERLQDADVKQLLIAAGFERRTINYSKDNGKKSSRSYWIAALDAVHE